jgi:type II restriction enzyme
MSVGNFKTKEEAVNLGKYVSTKFLRALVGILKITQHITPATWAYVPVQDFTKESDINWKTTISNIDKQLYKKYNLTQEEVNFIETNVKELE